MHKILSTYIFTLHFVYSLMFLINLDFNYNCKITKRADKLNLFDLISFFLNSSNLFALIHSMYDSHIAKN